MKRLLLIVLIICGLCLLLQGTVATGNKVVAENCICHIVVECYYPGYVPGDLPFASQTVNSCTKAEEYMRYMSETVKYPNDWIEIPSYSPPVFFFLYPAKS